ncbi:hypothetical protein [Gelidibacter mesophilus]|uniref:hypothetical protein n=1 Tax=Gelidibacter mesophilus TaxID=169050 RepID=UPI0004817DCD|nr:hypothetical protein [Gelidibacter mesophilus]
MKSIFSIIFIAIITLGCSYDNDDHPINCDFKTIISPEEYINAPSAALSINSLEIVNDCLIINYSSSGCDGKSWEVKLIDSGELMESNPPQRNLRLSLKNNEECFAIISKESSFDISNLKIKGNKVILNITNTDDKISYDY